METFKVDGGETVSGPFVSIICAQCRDGLAYWDMQTHGKPSLLDLLHVAHAHVEGKHSD